VGLVLDDVEAQRVEHGAHVVELVLRLRDELVKPRRDRPRLLRFGERPEVALAAPVAARRADPLIEHALAVESDRSAEPRD
jgi:hypothetical protein